VIFLPEYQQQAKQLFLEFCTLTKHVDSPLSMEVDNDNTAYHSNASSYRYCMHEIFGQEVAESFPALPTSPTPPSPVAPASSLKISESKSKQSRKHLVHQNPQQLWQHPENNGRGSKKTVERAKKLYWDSVAPTVSSVDATKSESSTKFGDDTSIKSELRELKWLLISSHSESQACQWELMKHKVDVLLHALEEVSH
jgi:hypothetical protein